MEEQLAERRLPVDLMNIVNSFRPVCEECDSYEYDFAPGCKTCLACVCCAGCHENNTELTRYTSEGGKVLWLCNKVDCRTCSACFEFVKTKTMIVICMGSIIVDTFCCLRCRHLSDIADILMENQQNLLLGFFIHY